MRASHCAKCKIKPDVSRSAVMTIVKCPKCGQTEGRIFDITAAIEDWNVEQRRLRRAAKAEGKDPAAEGESK